MTAKIIRWPGLDVDPDEICGLVNAYRDASLGRDLRAIVTAHVSQLAEGLVQLFEDAGHDAVHRAVDMACQQLRDTVEFYMRLEDILEDGENGPEQPA